MTDGTGESLTMVIWHLTSDTPRFPFHVSEGENVNLQLGTWPIEGGQKTWIELRIVSPDGTEDRRRAEGTWNFNREGNSYWYINIGPFGDGDQVEYRLGGMAPSGNAKTKLFAFRVRPKIHLTILWHQHQPMYKNLVAKQQRGAYRFPWVRLHALRDYYAMAALLERYPQVHLTINLTPVLLMQLEDYAERGVTDRALDLTLAPAQQLSAVQREELLETFFEADWHTQIYPWPRYRELFEQRLNGKTFTPEDLTDLQMWFNLVWFAPEFQEGDVQLPDGSVISVRGLIEKNSGYTQREIADMAQLQRKILTNVVTIHRDLQDRGQLEIATTPFYHPILPLIADTDQATIDRPGAVHPTRFARPEDAAVQVQRAAEFYRERFGRAPHGMWPAEGAVGQTVVSLFADAGIHWIATDRGVLERSGRYGYNVQDPNVLSKAYRAEDESGRGVAVFFRDTELSDRIGFHYQRYADAHVAAADFLRTVKERFAWRVDDPENRIVTVALDGENPWGAYPQQGRPFLHALYAALAADPEIRTVTFREYLEGNAARRVPAHPPATLTKVYDLFHASWIDENGSLPGNDLGTWIGESEENRAWDLLRQTRDDLDGFRLTARTHPPVFDSLYAAEGSDWFWWFGEDQASDSDADFDDLFRMHLKNVYRAAAQRAPARLDGHIVPHAPIWTFVKPVGSIQTGDRLIVRTNCPGCLRWRTSVDRTWTVSDLIQAGGVMAGMHRFGVAIGPFLSGVGWIEFRFHCAHPACCGTDPCCRGELQRVAIVSEEGQGINGSSQSNNQQR
jgi:alpha-amylase/alpha-mannosidase (GH57 family)